MEGPTSAPDPVVSELITSLHARGGSAHIRTLIQDIYAQPHIEKAQFRPFLGLITSLIDREEIVKLGDGYYALYSLRKVLESQAVSKYPDQSARKRRKRSRPLLER